MSLMQGRCDVCGRDRQVGVACTPLAAMSIAYCLECLQQEAEPEWLIEATIECCGGREHVHPEILKLKVFRNGQYEPRETSDAA